jgi:hypothetical protein
VCRRWKFIPRPRCGTKLGSLSQYFPHQLVIIHDEREQWLRQRLAKKSIIGISPFCYLSRCQLARRSRWQWRNSDASLHSHDFRFCTHCIVFLIFHASTFMRPRAALNSHLFQEQLFVFSLSLLPKSLIIYSSTLEVVSKTNRESPECRYFITKNDQRHFLGIALNRKLTFDPIIHL